MQLQTVIGIEKPKFHIDYHTQMMMLGSCFVENMGAKLEYFKFSTDINPCGIVYNPMSVADTLGLLLTEKTFTPDDLYLNDGKWISFSHHGCFSDRELTVCLQNINTRLRQSAQYLKRTDILVITWGTAWVYRYKATGKVVANCHKFPASDFERFRLEVGEIEKVYVDLLNRLKVQCPGIKVLFTVSPIRHWKDGAHGNQLSKSVLMLAIDKLMEQFDNVFYFPSYEIVMDELRDYRFYAEDMLHISPQGIEYIWEKFRDTYLQKDTLNWMAKIDKLNKILNHRPSDPDSPAYRILHENTLVELQQILKTLRKG